ncbi:hypothetical protein L0Y59_02390 [Candidatus Uhrbacteria bacterium]|nr:hypothetical protein [Candidatus Uhrbacteria bacterium]
MTHRLLTLCSAFALLAAACGGTDGGTGDGGDGGDGAGAGLTTTSDTTTTSETTSVGGAGGAEPCYPTAENGFCADADSCECRPMIGTRDEWCDAYENIGVNICPDGSDVCTPGHNRCGYDLPPGVDYESADPTCVTFVNGDKWAGNGVQSNVSSDVNENGQRGVAFGIMFGGSAEYYNGFIMSGRTFYWNRANAAGYESGVGEISPDCKSITVRFYDAGQDQPYAEYLATHVAEY